MLPLKILITGAVGSGKTTFVQSLSDIDVVETDEHTTELIGKSQTTVALDYGQTTRDDRLVHLFGTPGQERFAYMWETLSQGADGMVVLLNATRDDAVEQTQVLIDRIHHKRGDLPYVLGVTRTDESGADVPDLVAPFQDDAYAVTQVDAREPAPAGDLLDRLLQHVADE